MKNDGGVGVGESGSGATCRGMIGEVATLYSCDSAR